MSIPNPQAFPTAQQINGNGDVIQWADCGMTLRDYFAAAALPAVIRELRIHEDRQNEFAVVAYEIADSMLAEREKVKP